MAGFALCVFVNIRNMWSYIIPGIESIFAFIMFQISICGIATYFISQECFFARKFRIPVLVHIVLIVLEILNTWYFKSNSLLASFHSESSNMSTTTNLIEIDENNKSWWRIYIKHYFVTIWKIVDLVVEISFLIVCNSCPWT
jgi:hypothetical protein